MSVLRNAGTLARGAFDAKGGSAGVFMSLIVEQRCRRYRRHTDNMSVLRNAGILDRGAYCSTDNMSVLRSAGILAREAFGSTDNMSVLRGRNGVSANSRVGHKERCSLPACTRVQQVSPSLGCQRYIAGKRTIPESRARFDCSYRTSKNCGRAGQAFDCRRARLRL